MNMKKLGNEHYIEKFESDFAAWVEDVSGVVASGGVVQDLKPCIQALVNAYHEVKGGLDSVPIPNFNTLKLFVLISGASEAHSGENESLNILEAARRSVSKEDA